MNICGCTYMPSVPATACEQGDTFVVVIETKHGMKYFLTDDDQMNESLYFARHFLNEWAAKDYALQFQYKFEIIQL